MEVRVLTDNLLKVVEVDGDVDLYTSPGLRTELLELTKAGHKAILVDLKNVKYMDSSGIATLVEALQQVKKYGGKLRLANLRDAVKDVFELSRLDKVFDIFPSIEEAKTALD
ncbi:MAG: STAS domain-containing protein [bacterium]